MKKYKLLKDLPFAKAGEIFESWSDGTIVCEKCPSLPRMDKSDIEMFPLWFEEIEEPKRYWYVDAYGTICFGEVGKYVTLAEGNKQIGNYFETEKEAEKHLEWLKARAVLLEDAKGYRASLPNDTTVWTVYAYYSSYGERAILGVETLKDRISGEINFRTKEDVLDSVNNHTEEWKIYLGVK